MADDRKPRIRNAWASNNLAVLTKFNAIVVSIDLESGKMDLRTFPKEICHFQSLPAQDEVA